eukprot:s3193_g7.t1
MSVFSGFKALLCSNLGLLSIEDFGKRPSSLSAMQHLFRDAMVGQKLRLLSFQQRGGGNNDLYFCAMKELEQRGATLDVQPDGGATLQVPPLQRSTMLTLVTFLVLLSCRPPDPWFVAVVASAQAPRRERLP